MTTRSMPPTARAAYCPVCKRFLFRVGKSGDLIFQNHNATYGVVFVTCCGVTARYNAGRIEYVQAEGSMLPPQRAEG